MKKLYGNPAGLDKPYFNIKKSRANIKLRLYAIVVERFIEFVSRIINYFFLPISVSDYIVYDPFENEIIAIVNLEKYRV